MQAFRTEINFAIKICGTRKKNFLRITPVARPRAANDASLSRQCDRESRAIVKLDVYHRYLNRGGGERSQKPQDDGDKVNRCGDRGRKGEAEKTPANIRGHSRPIIRFN